MKKFIATILAILYIGTSMGATIHLHYCMDKLVGWSFATAGKSNCGKCGMEKKGHKGCCHDESKFVKLDKVHKATFNYFELLNIQVPLPKANPEDLEHLYVFDPITSYTTSNGPPIQQQVPIYLFISVFRI